VPSQPKRPEESFKVGDRVTVSLSAGRVVDGVVKAIINRTDGVSAAVNFPAWLFPRSLIDATYSDSLSHGISQSWSPA